MTGPHITYIHRIDSECESCGIVTVSDASRVTVAKKLLTTFHPPHTRFQYSSKLEDYYICPFFASYDAAEETQIWLCFHKSSMFGLSLLFLRAVLPLEFGVCHIFRTQLLISAANEGCSLFCFDAIKTMSASSSLVSLFVEYTQIPCANQQFSIST